MIEAARAAARAACELLVAARPETIKTKSNPRDLVTEWDPRCEQLIRNVLEEHAPGIPVLGEELGQGVGVGSKRWLVDPIDGTVNFAHGLPLWSISIALEDAGVTEVGVIAAPALGWWFEATRGGGARAWEIDRRGVARGAEIALGVSKTAAFAQALLVTGFSYGVGDAAYSETNFAEWEHMLRHAGSCRRLGSASLDLAFVAAGWIDGYWERRLQAWDLAAGALITVEASGTVTDQTGGPFDPHSGEVLASNGAIHDELIAALGRSRKS